MSRGARRKYDPSIPSHVDQRKLPKGVYWDNRKRVWYTLHRKPRLARQNIAKADATIADLHAKIEAIQNTGRGTVGWGLDRYHDSTEFKDKAESTQGQRDTLRAAIKARKTRWGKLGDTQLGGITRPAIQVLVEAIAQEGHPTKANHWLRYLRVAFRWLLNHGGAPAAWRGINPAEGVKQAKERKQFKMPTKAVMQAVQQFARAGAEKQAHTKGSLSPYLWAVIEIAYRCRLRGGELCRLTDASATPEGLRASRTKGSLDNITLWSPALREAWDALVAYRNERVAAHRHVVAIRPEDRHVLVTQLGTALSKSGLDSAWQDLMRAAVKADVIADDQRFTLHGLKHRGITDTKGGKAGKKEASGHKTDAMLHRYDHEVPVVKPAGE